MMFFFLNTDNKRLCYATIHCTWPFVVAAFLPEGNAVLTHTRTNTNTSTTDRVHED